MSIADDSVVEYMNRYNYDYSVHMSLRLYGSPNQQYSTIQTNRQIIREMLSPLSRHLAIKLAALIVIIPPPHQHAHILLTSSDEIDPLELSFFCDSLGGPLIRDKDTLVLRPINPNTLKYVCKHIVFEDGEDHLFNKNYLKGK